MQYSCHGFYVAVTNYHQELLPSELLFAIAAARSSIPFPVIFEIILMEFSFELIREAGVRIPAPYGSTIGIIGALILGEAAVNANIVSPILIIVVAFTGICSFAIPDFSLSFALRIFRFAFIMLGYLSGFLGIGLGLYVFLLYAANIKSFGISYFSPYLPYGNMKTNTSYFVNPIWKREFRSSFLHSKKEKQEDSISMEWKNIGKE